MKIRITEKRINAVPAVDEELGRGELTEVQVNGINALADEVFNELYYDYMDNDQSNLFEGYLGVVTYLADVEPAVALEIIACMMREHELDDQFDKVLAFVPKDEAHIKAFARHFAIAGIMKKLDEEAMEEDLEEEMEEEPEAEYDDHCKGCMGVCFGDCGDCRHMKEGAEDE
ncbi:MAG: hypothetical protein MSH28_03255 [Clostridiales bacterium]|nr:hypothetical protein [Clostridiales bacterium]